MGKIQNTAQINTYNEPAKQVFCSDVSAGLIGWMHLPFDDLWMGDYAQAGVGHHPCERGTSRVGSVGAWSREQGW